MFHDFINLLYPKICNCCEAELLNNERVICTCCLHELPLTNYHLENENPVKKVFYGRLEVVSATAFLHFARKTKVQQLMHNLKYRGQKDIGTYLGRWMGAQLSENQKFKEIEVVLPVPLHLKKLKSRGYNQVENFARELALSLNAEYIDDVLVKRTASATQTLKERLARWGEIEANFEIENSEKLQHKKVLLTDDIITTGATLEACGNKLNQIPGLELSLAAMAITD